jgi:integrase
MTYGTTWRRAFSPLGVDVRTVAGRLGHRNPSTTLNVYSHFVQETDQEPAETLGRIFEDADRPTSS